MKSFSIINEIQKKIKLNKLIESTKVEYDSINEAYSVKNDYLTAKIKLYENEGDIPHFHVQFAGYESCFCLFEAKYYNHEPHHVMMTDDHLYGLNIFLMSPVRKDPGTKKENWWDFLVQLWVEYHANQNYEHRNNWQNIKKPDYRETRLNKYVGKNNNCTKKY